MPPRRLVEPPAFDERTRAAGCSRRTETGAIGFAGGPLRPAAGGHCRGGAVTATQVRTSRVGEKLVGRVAFVTGGTRGIGAAISRSLASQGAEIAAGYSGNK